MSPPLAPSTKKGQNTEPTTITLHGQLLLVIMIVELVSEELGEVRSRREAVVSSPRSGRGLLINTHRAPWAGTKTGPKCISLSDTVSLKLVSSSGLGSAGLEDRLLRLA